MVVLVAAVFVFAVSAVFDLFNVVIAWIYRHDTWQLDEVFTVAVYLVIAFAVYAWRRHRDLVVQTRRREQAELETAQLIPELERARTNVADFQKILPVCPACKRIRDAKGDWYQLETYVELHYLAKFDDGFCPDCSRELYHKSFTRLKAP
jgi:hypothetical protein